MLSIDIDLQPVEEVFVSQRKLHRKYYKNTFSLHLSLYTVCKTIDILIMTLLTYCNHRIAYGVHCPETLARGKYNNSKLTENYVVDLSKIVSGSRIARNRSSNLKSCEQTMLGQVRRTHVLL